MFCLHSSLPPEKLRAELDRAVQVHNNRERGRCRLVLAWKSEGRFTVCMAEYEDSVGIECNGSIRSASRRRGAVYSAMLYGEIAPEGSGSVIAGHYRPLLIMWLLCVIAAGCVIGFAATGQPLACLLAAVLSAPLFRGLLYPERDESSGNLWDTLEYLLETVDGLAIEGAKTKETGQDKEQK